MLLWQLDRLILSYKLHFASPVFLFSPLYLCVLLSCLAKFQVYGFIYFSFSSRTPVAQPLVGAAYQDSPGEQKGIRTMACVWRDKEGDSYQHTSHETGRNSASVCVEQLPCARHSLGSCIEKIVTKPCNRLLRTSSLFPLHT